MPCQAFANFQNDDGDQRGDNYWGYMTLNYFAPNRRYAAASKLGAARREFQQMVDVLHQAGIKVYLDVVYNHTAEGILRRKSEENESRLNDELHDPESAALLSWRGIDNASYYALRSRPDLDGGRQQQRYADVSACGGSFDFDSPFVTDFVVDSLRYWRDVMGVDGFRFDLAPALGWQHDSQQFAGDAPMLQRIRAELPDVDLIAEPWTAAGGYCLGAFADGWAEWNDVARERLRLACDLDRAHELQPWMVADIVSGSAQSFSRDYAAGGQPRRRRKPAPWCSVNYLTSHDGFTLRDLITDTFTDAEQAGQAGSAGGQHGTDGAVPGCWCADAASR